MKEAKIKLIAKRDFLETYLVNFAREDSYFVKVQVLGHLQGVVEIDVGPKLIRDVKKTRQQKAQGGMVHRGRQAGNSAEKAR